MKAVDFDYERPRSVAALCGRLAEAGADAKILAGGQTLVPLMAMRLARPSLLLDINAIAELQGIAFTAGAVAIRACTRQAAALADETVRLHLPLLEKALRFVGHVQTRNRGTIGGSLANADPAAEIAIVALTLDAAMTARSASGERTIAAADFFHAPMETALAPEECLTEVRFPVWSEEGRIGAGFQEVSVRQSDFALSAAAAQIALGHDGTCRRIALCVGGASATPQRMKAAEERLLGTRLEARDLADAAALVHDAVNPLEDHHASRRYRRRVAAALVERAVAEAVAA
ncbi:MAG TPA: FAD binding domain-containing protein [Stellaceae bacterium]|nr:FAD binding domain-containing protein [Stellaceae bacterium]